MKSSLRIIYALIVFILGIVLLSVLTVIFFYENSRTKASLGLVNRSQVTRFYVEKVFSTLKDADRAYNNHMLTADPAFQGDADRATRNMAEHFRYLDSLVQDQVQQADQVHRLERIFQNHLEHLSGMSERMTRDAAYSRTDKFKADVVHGSQALKAGEALTGSILQSEFNLLQERKSIANQQSLLPTITGISVSIFSIIIFILAFYFTNAELKNSNKLNNELEVKNLQLEKYARELSTFTDVITHDMQEPLRKIQLFISLIENRDKATLSPNGLKYFDKIKKSVSRMRQLFISILNFSLANNTRNQVQEVDLNDVLTETLESLKIQITDTTAVIEADSLPLVKGVRYQLVQLFENVISNAIKYKRHDQTPRINIACDKVEGNKTGIRELKRERLYYRISFTDNGIGFDQQYAEKIFEIFQRLHNNEDNYGIGIGLPICRKIADNHEGVLTASARVNQGASFTFYIPADKTTPQV